MRRRASVIFVRVCWRQIQGAPKKDTIRSRIVFLGIQCGIEHKGGQTLIKNTNGSKIQSHAGQFFDYFDSVFPPTASADVLASLNILVLACYWFLVFRLIIQMNMESFDKEEGESVDDSWVSFLYFFFLGAAP